MADIGRREYKMMLMADRFRGDRAGREQAVAECWHNFTTLLEGQCFGIEGELSRAKPGKQRRVMFLDTPAQSLRRELGVVIRLRKRRNKKRPWDTTLKFRSGDRIQSAHHQFRCREGIDGKEKHEEDIKAPFGSQRAVFLPLFSRSATAERFAESVPKDIGACLKPFKDLNSLNLPDAATPVHPVNGFEADEHTYEGATVALSKNAEAKCGLVVWTDRNGDPDHAAVAEFSFRYDLKNGGTDVEAARRAWQVFETLYGLSTWVDPAGTTKTAFAYARRP